MAAALPGRGGFAARLRSVDMYRRIPKDLTESTLLGAVLSLISAAVIGTLFYLNLKSMFEGACTCGAERSVLCFFAPSGEAKRGFFHYRFETPLLSRSSPSLRLDEAFRFCARELEGKKRNSSACDIGILAVP